MKSPTPTSVSLCILCLSSALSGCAAPTERVVTPGKDSADAQLGAGPMVNSPDTPPANVAFSGTPAAMAAPTEHQLGDSARSTRLVGLYGEFDNSSPSAGMQFDGSRNLGQITTATVGSCIDPDVDRTGNWLAFASTMHRSTTDIYVKSVHGETLTQITDDPADDVMPCFSPDGKSIAFCSNRSGNWDIYTSTLDGKRTVQITSGSDAELHPSWSPDGRMLTYCKLNAQTQRWEIWIIDVNNTGTRDLLCYGLFPQWCPDPAKNKILFQRSRQRDKRDYGVWTVDVVNGQAMFPTEIASASNAALINPAWSPDGSRIVFVSVVEPNQSSSERPGQSDLWVVNLDGTGRTSLTNGQFANYQPVWASDGTVFFITDRSGSDNVWAVSTGRGGPGKPEPTGVASAESATLDSSSHP